MALLTVAKRKSYFKKLGLGEYTKENIKKLQKKYMRAVDVDGIYGTNTDNLLRHLYNVKTCAPNFSPQEFKCECGGRYCTGYPSFMKQVELRNLQRIRSHYNKPMTITCGLRCRTYNNKCTGSIPNSLHLTGYAADFYMPGVTDTLANRRASIKYIKTLPHHHYTYGNGINSNGYAISAPYMGNAMHTDTSPAQKKAKKKPEPTPQDKMCEWAKKVADGQYHYVKWRDGVTKTHTCPICNGRRYDDYYGWNCIGYAWASLHHGAGVASRCSCSVFTDYHYNKLLTLSDAEAQKLTQERVGIKDIHVYRSASGFSLDKLKKGDIIAYFTSKGYIHTALYLGNGLIADCTSGRVDNIKYGVPSYTNYKIKLVFRYTGK